MGGKVWINDSSGQKLYETYYASNGAFCEREGPDDCFEEYKLDGIINDLEIRDARIRLEKEINQSWFNPMTPWKIQCEDPVATPNGYTMVVTVHMDERYMGNAGWWIFQPEERVTKEVTMSMRWEDGKIRLYQCKPPPYEPRVDEEETPQPRPPADDDDSIIASIVTFFFGPGAFASL